MHALTATDGEMSLAAFSIHARYATQFARTDI